MVPLSLFTIRTVDDILVNTSKIDVATFVFTEILTLFIFPIIVTLNTNAQHFDWTHSKYCFFHTYFCSLSSDCYTAISKRTGSSATTRTMYTLRPESTSSVVPMKTSLLSWMGVYPILGWKTKSKPVNRLAENGGNSNNKQPNFDDLRQ